MQKPFTIAVVGNGRSRSFCVASQPFRLNSNASSAVFNLTNSLTSAPAMKLSFAERITSPLGFVAAISSSAVLNSSSASREKVLVDSPALSKVSQARPCASFSQRKCFIDCRSVV